MNKKILLLEVILALVIVLGFKLGQQSVKKQAAPQVLENFQKRMAIFCAPDWNVLDADSLGKAMKPLPGWGNYQWHIETKADSAQFYFNQGINMYYAFHIIESLGSFKKAAEFDSTNAMIFWGQALAYGPNINDYAYAVASDALIAVQKARQYSAHSNPREKTLIQAMELRYSADSTISRETLNEYYATAMLNAWKKFNDDADVGALYADARMLQHPWDYWKHNGTAQTWTPEIIDVIERSLKTAPGHPGLNHYYIHMTEASPDPGRALASAKQLETMMPDVSHMVHMPSHVYIRTGKYQSGVNVNDFSINGYKKYLDMYPDVQNNMALYLIHNLHMKAACLMMLPGYEAALKAARECATSFDTSFLSLPHPLGNMVQYIYMTPMMVQVQFSQWQDLLAADEISSHWTFARALSHWGRGMAYAETGKLMEAKKELALLRQALNHPDLHVPNPPFNTPVNQVKVGEKLLDATIQLKESNIAGAISKFKETVVLEDKLVYTEPRDWLIPTRHFLASAYILSGDLGSAEKILKEDLKINPHNYHALTALKKIYTQQNKTIELKETEAELKSLYN